MPPARWQIVHIEELDRHTRLCVETDGQQFNGFLRGPGWSAGDNIMRSTQAQAIQDAQALYQRRQERN